MAGGQLVSAVGRQDGFLLDGLDGFTSTARVSQPPSARREMTKSSITAKKQVYMVFCYFLDFTCRQMWTDA